ncbi:MAG: hypothetical protein JSR48_10040 [Verrucomicrobia bacterium]|nr:hypothetical protein [Verrucomicrobiota bacterium]
MTARSPEYEWRLASTWTASGLDCAIVSVMLSDPTCRWKCGYVRVPEGHPWHGRDCEDINSTSDGLAFGGITWSGEMPERLGDGWWVGFDTAHGTGPWDWPLGQVVTETRHLARHARRAAREAA